MKYKIDWLEIKTSSKGSKYAKSTVTDEQGIQKENVAIFGTFPNFAELAPGSEVEAELIVKDYNGSPSYSLEAPKVENGRKPNMDRLMEKKSNQIAEAQTNKAQQIAQAQDRSAWMWAKTNASMLLGDSMSSANTDTIARRVLQLATEIYNGEPLKPF